MARNLIHQGRGRFESLEQRQLLAGDVAASLAEGNLRLEGDELANKILITSGAEAGSFVVTGLDGTMVVLDGVASTAATVEGVRNIRVQLGDEADLAAVVGANLRGRLSIDAGLGDDRVLIGTAGDATELVGHVPADLSVNVRGAVSIKGGAGADVISVDDATIGALLHIDAGLDDDNVSLGSAAIEGAGLSDSTAQLNVRGVVHVNLGAGDDVASLNRVDSRVATVVRGGAGNNMVDASLVNTGVLSVFGDGDVDNVELADIHAHLLGVHTGAGDDLVNAHDSVFSTIAISLGDGNDTLAAANLEARFGALLGGNGDDTLEVQGELGIAHELIRGFEIPPDVNVGSPIRRFLGRLLGRLR
jgi:hypothetical protein